MPKAAMRRKDVEHESGPVLPAARSGPSNRVVDQVYRRLRSAIIQGDIEPRTRLVEVDLAQALGASRTPVREAISRLVSDRLVAPLAHGGVEVVDTARELEDIYNIREALEGCVARLAAERITEDELAELRRLLERTRKTADEEVEERVAINNEFHAVITRASRSPRLIQLIEGFREFFLTPQRLGRYTERETRKAQQQHAEILDALVARDGKRAERLVRRHLEFDRRRILKPRYR